MSVSVVFRASLAAGPTRLLAPRPRPQLYAARGVAVGDLTGGTVTMRLSWDQLRVGQIAVCRQSFFTRGDGGASTMTLQGGGVIQPGFIDNVMLARYRALSASPSTEGSFATFLIPAVVRQREQAADMPYLDAIWGSNQDGVQYRWLSWWVVADLLQSAPEDILLMLSLPQDSHP